MLHRLDPLELGLDFDDRPYRLGETVALRVEIVPKGRTTIREAGVELLCDQKFAETYTISGPGRYSNTGEVGLRPDISSQVGDERLESYVHSRTAFLSDVTLEPVNRGASTSASPSIRPSPGDSTTPTPWKGTQPGHGPSTGGSSSRSTWRVAATQGSKEK